MSPLHHNPRAAHRASAGLQAIAVVTLLTTSCSVFGDEAGVAPTTSVLETVAPTSTTTIAVPTTTQSVSTTTSTVASLDPTGPIARLLDGIAEATPAGYDAARSVATPESPAAAYITYLSAVAEVTGGQPTVREAGVEEVRLCGDTGCRTYSAFDTDTLDNIVTFSVDGLPLAGRVITDGPIGSSEGIETRIVAGYQNSDDVLFVVVEVNNDTRATFQPLPFAATYVSASGDQRFDASAAFGPELIGPGERALSLLSYADASLGGTLVFSGLLGDDRSEIRIAVAVETAP